MGDPEDQRCFPPSHSEGGARGSEIHAVCFAGRKLLDALFLTKKATPDMPSNNRANELGSGVAVGVITKVPNVPSIWFDGEKICSLPKEERSRGEMGIFSTVPLNVRTSSEGIDGSGKMAKVVRGCGVGGTREVGSLRTPPEFTVSSPVGEDINPEGDT